MGHMDVISIIANGFNVYFPMIMIIISAATYFNVGSHFLSVIGFPQYLADDEITEDIVIEGQRLAIAGILLLHHLKRHNFMSLSFDENFLLCWYFIEKERRSRKCLFSAAQPSRYVTREPSSRCGNQLNFFKWVHTGVDTMFVLMNCI